MSLPEAATDDTATIAANTIDSDLTFSESLIDVDSDLELSDSNTDETLATRQLQRAVYKADLQEVQTLLASGTDWQGHIVCYSLVTTTLC
jgi:hypothetical protein